MTLVPLDLELPLNVFQTTAVSYANTVLDATGEYLAFFMVSPISDVIEKIGFRTLTVSGGGDFDIRIETVGTNGQPTGTLWGTNTNFVQTVLGSDGNIYFEATLTAGATVAAGDLFAIVIRWVSGSASFVRQQSCNRSFPTCGIATPTYSAGSQAPVTSIYYTSAGYYPIAGICPFSGIVNTSLSSTTTPDVLANKITMPVTATVSGFWFNADVDSPLNFKLYDSDGVTVLASILNDTDIPVIGTQSKNYWYFNPVTLTQGNTYWFGLEGTTSTNSVVTRLDFPTTAIKSQYIGGSYMVASTAKDPSGTGSWTDITDSLFPFGLLFSAVDVGGGGGPSEHSFTFIG